IRLCHQPPIPNMSRARSRIASLACRSPIPAAIRPRVSTSANSSAALACASSSRATRTSSSSTSSATPWTLAGGLVSRHYLEREPVRLVADRHPAPLRELVPAALRAKAGTVPRGAGPAERGVRVVVERLVVDVHDAGVQLISHGPPAVARAGLDRGHQPVLGVVRDGDGLAVVL